MSAAWTEEFRQALDRLTERGLSREVAAEIWWAGSTRMAADLEAASDDALAEISRLWRARQESVEALARNVAQASQNRGLTASGPESGQGDHRDDEGRSGARDGSGS